MSSKTRAPDSYPREHLLDLTRRRLANAALTPGQPLTTHETHIFAPGIGVGKYKIKDRWVVVSIDGMNSARWSGPSALDALDVFTDAVTILGKRIKARQQARLTT
jgi:hypothetical protein